MKKLLFVFNPLSGKGLIKEHIAQIIDIFAKADYEGCVRPTQCENDAYEYIRRHADSFDRIVVSGGDGTLNEAVKGLTTYETSNRKPLGYIPSGTANDVASTLGIPKNMIDAARIAVYGTEFKCDIGQFNEKTFNYVAAFGAFTEVSYDTPQIAKNTLGHMAYFWEGIKRLPTLASQRVKIKYDGGVIEDDIFLCMVLNATSVAGIDTTGKIMNVELNDGLFEMLVFKRPTNIFEFQSVLSGLIKGETTGEGYVIVKSSHFEFTSDNDIKWTLDGEYGGLYKHTEIKVLPSAITYIIGKS